MEKTVFIFMPQTKDQKKKVIEDLKDQIGKQKSIVFLSIEGLKAKEVFDLRKQLKKEDCKMVVSKKTLMDLAFKGKKIGFDKKNLKGQIALVFGFKEEIPAARIPYQFSLKQNKLKILGGVLGNNLLVGDEVLTLAKLPSKNELYAKVAGTINAPVANFVRVLQGNIRNLVYVLAKIKA